MIYPVLCAHLAGIKIFENRNDMGIKKRKSRAETQSTKTITKRLTQNFHKPCTIVKETYSRRICVMGSLGRQSSDSQLRRPTFDPALGTPFVDQRRRPSTP